MSRTTPDRMPRPPILLAAALLAIAGAATAQSTHVAAQSSTDTAQSTTDTAPSTNEPAPPTARTTVQADADADARVDRYCIRETGSRIPVARKAGTDGERKACTRGRGRVYTRQDIDASGRVDLADALRALDTSIR